ncbi:MAG TPA: transposase [Gemmatimonadales bacterium]|nr:transposase [Gemmatimonadales bacterium]
MRHRLYFHVSWTTSDREPTITAQFARFLARFLPLIARQERANVLALGAVRTHLHLVVRVNPATSLSRLIQRWKGGSSLIGNRDGMGGAGRIRWAKGCNIESVSPRALADAMAYVRRQAQRHPGEAIPDLGDLCLESPVPPSSGSPSATWGEKSDDRAPSRG